MYVKTNLNMAQMTNASLLGSPEDPWAASIYASMVVKK